MDKELKQVCCMSPLVQFIFGAMLKTGRKNTETWAYLSKISFHIMFRLRFYDFGSRFRGPCIQVKQTNRRIQYLGPWNIGVLTECRKY